MINMGRGGRDRMVVKKTTNLPQVTDKLYHIKKTTDLPQVTDKLIT
jgi:hypothetical protein